MIVHSDWRTAALADLLDLRPELAEVSIAASVRDAVVMSS